MNRELKIKTESLPIRCEVCHQADLFDPHTGYCQRCKQTAIINNQAEKLAQPSKRASAKPGEALNSIQIGWLIGIWLVGFFLTTTLLFNGLPEGIIIATL